MKKNNNKGFTLAELLIVVAIIAVLTAVAIPVFTAQLEKSRDTTSAANIRSAYAEAQATYLSEVSSDPNVTIKYDTAGTKIASIEVANVHFSGVQSGWSDALANMPNNVDWSGISGNDAMGGAAGDYTVTFTYTNSTTGTSGDTGTFEIKATAAKKEG